MPDLPVGSREVPHAPILEASQKIFFESQVKSQRLNPRVRYGKGRDMADTAAEVLGSRG